MPKGLARGALLFALGVLDAERGLGNEVQPFLWNVPSADDALAVLAAVQAPEGLVDETDASLEHRLPREVELPRLGLARDVGGVLVGECDVTTALALRHGEALLDAFDRRYEVCTFALESLAHRI